MGYVLKYENLEKELPKLQKVLLNTIQSEFLEIRSIAKACKKYLNACEEIPALADAEYVVYSKFMDKANHPYEKFIFLDKDGAELCNVSGSEMELYGLLSSCDNLYLSEEYKQTH